MSKVTLASGSFIVGVCCSLIALSVIPTSTLVHAQGGVLIARAEPVVPPLLVHTSDSSFSVPLQALDGINCERCTIEATVVTYAGGAFRCVDCTIRSKDLQFKGAALNTFKLLKSVGAIPRSPLKNTNPQNAPMEEKIEINPQTEVTWISLEGLEK